MVSQPSVPEPKVIPIFLDILSSFSFYRSPPEHTLTLDINILIHKMFK